MDLMYSHSMHRGLEEEKVHLSPWGFSGMLGPCQPPPLSYVPELVQPLVVAGAAGTAEAGVVLTGAETGVDNQLTVCQLRLVHTVTR